MVPPEPSGSNQRIAPVPLDGFLKSIEAVDNTRGLQNVAVDFRMAFSAKKTHLPVSRTASVGFRKLARGD